MSDKEVIDAVANVLVNNGIVESDRLFIGRIYPNADSVWSVSLLSPAEAYGGNNAKYKRNYSVTIDAYDSNAEKLYSMTEDIRNALANLVDDEQVISIELGGLSDLDTDGGEMRHVRWIVQVITYAPGWKDWED